MGTATDSAGQRPRTRRRLWIWRDIWELAGRRGVGILPAAPAARVSGRSAAAGQYRFLGPQPVSRPAFFSSRRYRRAPQIEALLGAHFPSWPIADAGLSLVAGFLLLDCCVTPCIAASMRCRFLALSRAASLGSRCRCDDLGAPPSARVFVASALYLARGDRARYSADCRAEPRSCRVRHGAAAHGNIRLPRVAGTHGCSRCWSRSICTASTTRLSSSRPTATTAPSSRSGTGCLAPTPASPGPSTKPCFWCPRAAAARMPEAVRDVHDALAGAARGSR